MEIEPKIDRDAVNMIISGARLNLIAFEIATNPKYQPNWHHDFIANELENIEKNGDKDYKILIVTVPPRHGKALEIHTPVPTPDGWKQIGELKIGDYVFNENGLPIKVKWISPIWKNRNVYKVKTDDGDELIADENHEWLVRLDRKYPVLRKKTTRQLAERTSPRNPLVWAQRPLLLPAKDLPIHPYVLGVWLGDGHSNTAYITQGKEDYDFIANEVERCGYEIIHNKTGNKFYIKKGWGKLNRANLLKNKHIPLEYLRASQEQRLSLLQGLVDTDGYVALDGQIEITTIFKNLAFQIKELIASLGGKASINMGRAMLYGKDCGEKYRVCFYMENAARLPRKAINCRQGIRAYRRYLTFEPAGSADTICIEVESESHLFLAGLSMIPTCNSQQCSIDFPAWYLGRNPDKEIIIASHTAELAQEFGAKTREKVNSEAYKAIFHETSLREDEQARGHWRTKKGGSYIAVGVGGALTGRGANVLLLDDVIKNREEAESDVFRKKTWDWFTSTAFTRLEPKGVVVLILTRWHSQDLAGLILGNKDLLPRTKLIKFPAFRNKDEALWPQRFDKNALLEIKSTLGPYDWSALYMGSPILSENQEFKPEWIRTISEPPLLNPRRFLSVDTAMSKKASADFTGFCDNSVSLENFWHLRAWRQKLSPEELVETLFVLHQTNHYEAIGIEKTAYTEGLKPFLDIEQRRRNKFLPIVELRHDQKAKELRIRGLIPRYASRSVFHIEGACKDLEEEMFSFPVGKYDDCLDACAYQLQLADQPHKVQMGELQVFLPEYATEY